MLAFQRLGLTIVQMRWLYIANNCGIMASHTSESGHLNVYIYVQHKPVCGHHWTTLSTYTTAVRQLANRV